MVGQSYRVVMVAPSDGATAASDERVLEANRCEFVGNLGDWWGFVGADGISRLVVNPDRVVYLEMQAPVDGTSTFGYFA
jgi:hypothetical protein